MARLSKARVAILVVLVLGVCVFPGIRIVTALRVLDVASASDAGPRLLDCLAAGGERCNDKTYQARELSLDGQTALVARGAAELVYGDLWLQVGDERLHCYSVVAERRRLPRVPGWLSGAGEVQSADPRCTRALMELYAR